jgi:hypothetical protein
VTDRLSQARLAQAFFIFKEHQAKGESTMNKKVIIAVLIAVLALAAFATLTMAQAVSASLSAPANNATVSGKVVVSGTAGGSNFGYYKVEFQSGSDWVWVDGQAHNAPVTNGTLATWDTSSLPDGKYGLRLLVADVTGQYITTDPVSVNVANSAAKAAAAAPRRGCLACHVQISPDGRYTLGFEAVNAAKAAGITHPTLPNGFKTTYAECMACHSAGGVLPMSSIVHPAHMFSTTFVEHYSGNCFTCHELKNGKMTVLSDKATVNAKGIILPGAEK